MAEPLKNHYGPAIPRRIAASIAAVCPSFPERAFVAEVLAGYEELELMARGRHIAHTLRRYLPEDFEEAMAILLASLGPARESAQRTGLDPFVYLPHTLYIAEYGLESFETSMRAQYELTKRFTAEFSIRSFLAAEPERTLARLREWARDPDEHVRRAVSEGTRPRLPWAARLVRFQRDPRPVLELLELLKDDPSSYVRRSVANNLNDIGKDHPALLVKTCRAWARGATPERRWLIRHALRSLVKRGDPGALRLLGFRDAPAVRVGRKVLPRVVRLGERASIAFEVVNASPAAERVLVDLRVFFVKAKGALGSKVFKIRSLALGPRERILVQKTISFEPLTTRRAYPGRHRVDALLNGRAIPLGAFEVVSGSGGSKRSDRAAGVSRSRR